MMPPTSIDGTDITGATIDGTEVQEITVDGQTVFTAGPDIPDAGDLQVRYDATEISASDGDPISTWNDQTGNGFDLTAGNAPTFKTGVINGSPVVRFDGVNDFLNVDFGATESQPNHIFILAQKRTSGNNDSEPVFDGFSTDHLIRSENDGPFWNLFAGGNPDDGLDDTNVNIFSVLFDGANSEMRINGTVEISADAGTSGLDGVTLGANRAANQFGDYDIGEVLVYPQDKSSIVGDVESYLGEKWGVTV